jgi:hypothetical protein
MTLSRTLLGRTVAAAGILATVVAASPAMAAHDEHAGEGAGGAATACFVSGEALGGLPAGGLVAARPGARDPSAWKSPPVDEAPASGRNVRVTIPVSFHVFTDGAEGRLTETQLRRQVDVLNAGFAGREGGVDTGLRLAFAGMDVTDNATWFRDLDPGTAVEREAKAATHVGDARTLNVWTTAGPSYLGFATFPSWYKRAPQLDGIVLDHNSLPGGAYGTSYSLGETGTHEVGHWLGLLHTFQGACNANGDYVDDTPAMATPSSGCPEGKDTCPAPGTDPVRNYMDYSYDSCYTQFTQGQAQRMSDQFAWFRASGGQPVGVGPAS